MAGAALPVSAAGHVGISFVSGLGEASRHRYLERMATPLAHPAGEHAGSSVRASRLAREVLAGQADRYGDPVLEHVARVASRVPAPARVVALLHGIVGASRLSVADVAHRAGLADHERHALELLVARDGEDALTHAERLIATAPGPARDLALTVARADVADHTDRAPLCTTSAHARAAATLAGA